MALHKEMAETHKIKRKQVVVSEEEQGWFMHLGNSGIGVTSTRLNHSRTLITHHCLVLLCFVLTDSFLSWLQLEKSELWQLQILYEP